MKLKLHTPERYDKWLHVTDEDNPCGLSIRIDYDDVDQETVLRDTLAMIEKVNLPNKANEAIR